MRRRPVTPRRRGSPTAPSCADCRRHAAGDGDDTPKTTFDLPAENPPRERRHVVVPVREHHDLGMPTPHAPEDATEVGVHREEPAHQDEPSIAQDEELEGQYLVGRRSLR